MKRADTRPQAPGHGPVPRPRLAARPRARWAPGSPSVLAGALAGCSALSPATTVTPYAPSDGVNVDLGRRRPPAQLPRRRRPRRAAAAPSSGPSSTTATADGHGGARHRARRDRAAQPDPGERAAERPGAGRRRAGSTRCWSRSCRSGRARCIEMSAAAASAGAKFFEAPVLAPEGEYATLTVAPRRRRPRRRPRPTPTSSPARSTAEPRPGVGLTEEPTAEPDRT